jgi:hypothetical protein
MEVHDFDGSCRVDRDDELLARLRSVLRGTDGAFILDHGGAGSLWVHINGNAAFLWFCPDREGSQPRVRSGRYVVWGSPRCPVSAGRRI